MKRGVVLLFFVAKNGCTGISITKKRTDTGFCIPIVCPGKAYIARCTGRYVNNTCSASNSEALIVVVPYPEALPVLGTLILRTKSSENLAKNSPLSSPTPIHSTPLRRPMASAVLRNRVWAGAVIAPTLTMGRGIARGWGSRIVNAVAVVTGDGGVAGGGLNACFFADMPPSKRRHNDPVAGGEWPFAISYQLSTALDAVGFNYCSNSLHSSK